MNPNFRRMPADANAIRRNYLANLALQISNNQKNWNANQIFQTTGVTPTEPSDPRSRTDIVANIEDMKVQLRQALASKITDWANANVIVDGLTGEEVGEMLNMMPKIEADLKAKYSKGVPAEILLRWFRNQAGVRHMEGLRGLDLSQQVGMDTADNTKSIETSMATSKQVDAIIKLLSDKFGASAIAGYGGVGSGGMSGRGMWSVSAQEAEDAMAQAHQALTPADASIILEQLESDSLARELEASNEEEHAVAVMSSGGFGANWDLGAGGGYATDDDDSVFAGLTGKAGGRRNLESSFISSLSAGSGSSSSNSSRRSSLADADDSFGLPGELIVGPLPQKAGGANPHPQLPRPGNGDPLRTSGEEGLLQAIVDRRVRQERGAVKPSRRDATPINIDYSTAGPPLSPDTFNSPQSAIYPEVDPFAAIETKVGKGKGPTGRRSSTTPTSGVQPFPRASLTPARENIEKHNQELSDMNEQISRDKDYITQWANAIKTQQVHPDELNEAIENVRKRYTRLSGAQSQMEGHITDERPTVALLLRDQPERKIQTREKTKKGLEKSLVTLAQANEEMRNLEKYLARNEKKGRGRGIRLRGRGVEGVQATQPYVSMGKHFIHKHKLIHDGILQIRRKSGTTINHLPTQKISKHLATVLLKLIGNDHPSFEDMQKLADNDRALMNKIIKNTKIDDRLMLPTPERTEEEQEWNRFQVLVGETHAGNNSPELIKELKGLLLKMAHTNRLPKGQVREILMDLTAMGH